jgi:hypothetical protein
MVVLTTLLLAACGGSSEPSAPPTGHLRQAERICADARANLDRSGEGVLAAGQAYEKSRSRKDLAAIQRSWDDVWYVLSRVSKELRAAAKTGLDPKYDRFVGTWQRVTAQADRLNDVIGNEDRQVLADSLREIEAISLELQRDARAAGVPRCEAPLYSGA